MAARQPSLASGLDRSSHEYVRKTTVLPYVRLMHTSSSEQSVSAEARGGHIDPCIQAFAPNLRRSPPPTQPRKNGQVASVTLPDAPKCMVRCSGVVPDQMGLRCVCRQGHQPVASIQCANQPVRLQLRRQAKHSIPLSTMQILHPPQGRCPCLANRLQLTHLQGRAGRFPIWGSCRHDLHLGPMGTAAPFAADESTADICGR